MSIGRQLKHNCFQIEEYLKSFILNEFRLTGFLQ